MDRSATDGELLIQYARERSERAFAQVVGRHIDWVYSAARRQVRDPATAQDVAQTVFVLLARKAGAFGPSAAVDAWLFRTLRFVANDALRAQRRRAHHESQAGAQMRQSTAAQADRTAAEFDELAPVLERAVATLRGQDQRAILMRFYERKTYGEVAAALGTSEPAAQMRVSRALAKLRAALRRHNAIVPATAAVLGESMWQHAAFAAPAGLAHSVTAAAVSGEAAAAIPALKTILLTTGAAKLAASFAAAVALIAALGGAILFARREPPPAKIGFTTNGMLVTAQEKPRDETAWRQQFDRIYTLAQAEVVKRVAPPFVDARRDWIIATTGGMPVAETTEKTGPGAMQIIADPATGRASKVRGITPTHATLREVLDWGLDAPSYEIKSSPKLLDRVVTGDWLIRKDAPLAERTAAMERILREECNLQLTIERRRVADEVIVVAGAARIAGAGVQLYSDRLNRNYNPAYTDTGDFARFLVNLAGLTGRQTVNESSTPVDARVTWTSHDSAWVYSMAPKREAAKIDLLLQNVAKQTGLSLHRETRQVDRWFVTSDE